MADTEQPGLLKRATDFVVDNGFGVGGTLIGGAIASVIIGGPLAVAAFAVVSGAAASFMGDKKGVLHNVLGTANAAAAAATDAEKAETAKGPAAAKSKAAEPDIADIQKKLNRFNELATPSEKLFEKPLEVTGKVDEATKEAWVKFKKEQFADGKIVSLNYLKESKGLNIQPEELNAALGFDASNKEAAKAYNQKAPNSGVIALVQTKLGVEVNGILNEQTMAAIKKDKQDHWVDDRFNAGGIDTLDKQVAAREAAREQMQNQQTSPDRRQPPQPDRGNGGPTR